MFKGGGLPVKPKPGQTVEDYQKRLCNQMRVN